MLVVLVGPPGAGKGTQAERLARHLNVLHCSTGDMFREATKQQTAVGREASEYMQAGKLVPDSVVQRIVVERLAREDCQPGCVLDGFPRTLKQAEEFDLWAPDNYRPIDLVVEIQVDEQTLLSRLAGRGRQDDDEEVISQRFQEYERLTLPLLDYYQNRGILKVVDGVGTMDEVWEKIRQVIDQARQQS